jgi:hypothetical protein
LTLAARFNWLDKSFRDDMFDNAMPRRLLGVILCLFVISASATASYASFSALDCAIAIQLEPSFFSSDSFDDGVDTGYPNGLINRSVREKPLKLPLGFKIRISRFTTPALPMLHVGQPVSSQQELYRYQEVFRI